MAICDTHCHASLAWYAPVESLLHEMDANGVEQALLIQIRGQFDNSYQEECVRRYPGRFASVVIVDTTRADASEALARWAERGAAGIRLGADTRSPGEDPLAIWRAAARLGLPVSCQGSAEALASDGFAQLVQELPTLPIVLEHLAGLERLGTGGRTREQAPGGQSAAPDASGARERVLALARFPNVSVKVHGLGEFCVRAIPVAEPFPFVRPISPLLEDLYRAFGPDRLMWGSDYPPVAGREGYRLALRLVMDEYAAKDEPARAAIFGGTAAKLFPIRPQ
jgi:L-fuconolactonase